MRKYSPYLFHLVQGLFYPAMLGTFFVYLFQGINDNPNWINSDLFFFFLWLVFYFILSFTVTQTIATKKIYNKLTFVADMVEIIFMFLLLSIASLNRVDLFFQNAYQEFFFIACGLPIIQSLWNFSLHEFGSKYWILNGLFFLITFSYTIWFYDIFFARVIFLIVFSILILVYLSILVKTDKQFEE